MILGATGMLGSAMTRVMAERDDLKVVALSRATNAAKWFAPDLRAEFHGGLDVENFENLTAAFAAHKPDIVTNCIGVVKQLAAAAEVLTAVPINALLPHRLSQLCGMTGARLVHVSTDCVFSGRNGGYRESDVPDAGDLYGTSKLWGEVHDRHAITLRTSIIGPELNSARGLLGWFLSQTSSMRGFRRAKFSGLPTVELSRLVRDLVLPRPDLSGLYHVSTHAIDKDSLLRLFAAEYRKDIEIVPDDTLVIDRSLDSSRFRSITGYAPPEWVALVREMRRFG
jgi:dTDP-4-dehydrorhamnose reductase